MLAILDGVVLDAADAQISVTDDGLLRGDGVFEVVRLYDGRPFALEQHLDRMARSAAAIRLPFDVNAVRADAGAILAQAEPADGCLRLLVTRGGRRIGLVEPLKPLLDSVALATITYSPTRVLDGVKSLSYAANLLATRLAKEAGADEALLVAPRGRVLVAPPTAFVYGLGGKLYTPPLSDRILDSITRRALFAVTGIEERITTLDDLRTIEEAFLASSLREVHPVSSIDGTPLVHAPGPLSTVAAARVREHIAAELQRAT